MVSARMNNEQKGTNRGTGIAEGGGQRADIRGRMSEVRNQRTGRRSFGAMPRQAEVGASPSGLRPHMQRAEGRIDHFGFWIADSCPP